MTTSSPSRGAIIQRAQAVLGEHRPAPKTWSDLSLTEQLQIGTLDPELAQILQDSMPPALELLVLNGKLPAVAPAVKTDQELRAEAAKAAEEVFLANRAPKHEAQSVMQQQIQAQEQEAIIRSLNLPRVMAQGR